MFRINRFPSHPNPEKKKYRKIYLKKEKKKKISGRSPKSCEQMVPRADFAGITGRVRAPPKSPDPAVGGLCAGGCRPPPPPWAVTAALPSPGSGAPRAGEEGRPPPPAGCQAGTAAPPRGAVPGAPGGGGEGAEGGEPGAGPGNPIAGFFLVLFFFLLLFNVCVPPSSPPPPPPSFTQPVPGPRPAFQTRKPFK